MLKLYIFFLGAFLFGLGTILPNNATAYHNFNTSANYAIVIEVTTGKVLFDKNANARMFPASLTKLMTLYIVFDYLKQNNINLHSLINVSNYAYLNGGSRSGGSTMFLIPNQKVSIEDLIHGVATVSGNDASIVLAEAIAGSESQFATYMNIYAQKLGLVNSHFVNSTGSPANNHYSTAQDIATLSQRLILDFPEYYNFFNVKQFTFNQITQPNRNTLLFDESIKVDGLKTGHTEASGYSLAFSGTNLNGIRIVGVIGGLKTNKERTEESKKLLTWIFFNLGCKTLFTKGSLITSIDTWYGRPSTLKVYAPYDINLFYNKNSEVLEDYKVTIIHNNVLVPPIYKYDSVATITIQNLKDHNNKYCYNLFASNNIKKASFITRFFKTPYYLFKKIISNTI